MPSRVVSPAASVKYARPIWFEWDTNIGSKRNSKHSHIRDLISSAQLQPLLPEQSEVPDPFGLLNETILT